MQNRQSDQQAAGKHLNCQRLGISQNPVQKYDFVSVCSKIHLRDYENGQKEKSCYEVQFQVQLKKTGQNCYADRRSPGGSRTSMVCRGT